MGRPPTWPDPAFSGDPFGDPPDPGEPASGARELELRSAQRTGLEPARLAAEARRQGAERPLAGDPAPLPEAERVPTVADLVRMATDFDPGVAAEGVDRVLGPWAVDASPEALRAAVAVAAFLVGEDADASPVDRWLRETSPCAVKRGVQAARAAPFLPYRVRPAGPGRARLEPILPQGGSAPQGEVPWTDPPHPAGGDGGVAFARVARIAGGWAPVVALGVPAWPEEGHRWARWLGWTLPRPSGEELGRRRGHTLARWVLEQAWSRT